MVFRGKAADNPQRPSGGSEMPMKPLSPSVLSPRPSSFGQEGHKSEQKRLTVGPGISLSGQINDCDRLVVEGEARVTLQRVRAITITETGRFIEGKAEVEEAEIGGVYEGDLTVRGRLLICRTGRVIGTVHYGELEIERGGTLSGSVEFLQGPDGPALKALDGSAETGQARPASLGSRAPSSNLRPVDTPRTGSSSGSGGGEEPRPGAA